MSFIVPFLSYFERERDEFGASSRVLSLSLLPGVLPAFLTVFFSALCFRAVCSRGQGRLRDDVCGGACRRPSGGRGSSSFWSER